jgi:hypothetical protein
MRGNPGCARDLDEVRILRHVSMRRRGVSTSEMPTMGVRGVSATQRATGCIGTDLGYGDLRHIAATRLPSTTASIAVLDGTCQVPQE